MGFIEAIKSFYRRYFDFETRSSPSEYWWVYLFQFIVAILLLIPMIGAIATVDTTTGEASPLVGLSFIPLLLFWLVNFIPQIAVMVRRFHDQDKSGWMVLLCFIPYVGFIIAIVFMILAGTKGPNRFGPDPLGRDEDVFA